MNDFFAWLTGLASIVIPGFGDAPVPQYHGYVEAEYVYVAPASPGRISAIKVQEAEQVEKDTPLFELQDDQYVAALEAAQARQAVAEANWRNLETGSREEEVAVIRATLEKAQADQKLAQINLERTEQLSRQGLVPVAKLDTDRAVLASANAQVAQLQAKLDVAELPARDAQIVAAEASLQAARAATRQAQIALSERNVKTPAAGQVERVYFRVGEVAGVGVPVVVILPPGKLKVRFFIPEADRMKFELGEELDVSCEGCAPDISARLTYLSSDPQYTPPIIYSREQRTRLVYLAEAQIDDTHGLLPGQPVTLELPAGLVASDAPGEPDVAGSFGAPSDGR